MEIALDREDSKQAFTIHRQIENIIKSLNDDKLEFEYDLLKARNLQKLERINEAKEVYQNLSKEVFERSASKFIFSRIIFIREKV